MIDKQEALRKRFKSRSLIRQGEKAIGLIFEPGKEPPDFIHMKGQDANWFRPNPKTKAGKELATEFLYATPDSSYQFTSLMKGVPVITGPPQPGRSGFPMRTFSTHLAFGRRIVIVPQPYAPEEDDPSSGNKAWKPPNRDFKLLKASEYWKLKEQDEAEFKRKGSGVGKKKAAPPPKPEVYTVAAIIGKRIEMVKVKALSFPEAKKKGRAKIKTLHAGPFKVDFVVRDNLQLLGETSGTSNFEPFGTISPAMREFEQRVQEQLLKIYQSGVLQQEEDELDLVLEKIAIRRVAGQLRLFSSDFQALEKRINQKLG